jgi:drug/metabolite transporter (DMT)-like permease
MLWLAGIFSLLVAAAGWFYLFYSRAAQKLAGVEGTRANAQRVRLRRINGVAMILLGAAFYVGCNALVRHELSLFAGMMFAVLTLLATTLVLGLLDLRMTRKLRRDRQE